VPDTAMKPEEAAAFWVELQRALRLVEVLRQPAGRRRRTGEVRVTHTERRAMQAFHLLQGENYSTLAKRFRRDRHYLSRWIWDASYRAFHAHYWGTDEGHRIVEGRGRPPARTDGARPAA
jgi:hypothetical protein